MSVKPISPKDLKQVAQVKLDKMIEEVNTLLSKSEMEVVKRKKIYIERGTGWDIEYIQRRFRESGEWDVTHESTCRNEDYLVFTPLI